MNVKEGAERKRERELLKEKTIKARKGSKIKTVVNTDDKKYR